ncbi:16S rRNA (uracil(1498)-N(3))-methyltransferase, partial [Actinomyces sp. MRS3W]|uniref:16S rRNA (uracil(1498)-N(3))-methyltransferase n=1 Tax=Actinomyces sp. MRS3W TaxID=2800796 RepID=UPI0028FD9CEB
MTAPVFVFTPRTLEPAGSADSAAPGDLLALTGPEAHHAVAVRRLRVGERVDLVDGAGLRLVCEVTDVAADGGRRERLTARVVQRVEEPEAGVRLVLVQALAKGGRDEQAVETATEVGADVVLPWQADRCVSVWRGVKLGRGRERWQATVREAAKQARRARVPEVLEAVSTRQLCEWTAEQVSAGGAVLVLHEESRTPIGGVEIPAPVSAGVPGTVPVLAVVVGPEGGISEAETTALEAAGATTVRLGPHVMRT